MGKILIIHLSIIAGKSYNCPYHFFEFGTWHHDKMSTAAAFYAKVHAVFYAFTAYDNTWRCLFTDGSTVTFTVDGQSFYPSVRFFSRQIRNFPSVQTAARYEFILSSDLVDKLADAQTVVITSDSINYQLSTEEVDELHRVIARTHY